MISEEGEIAWLRDEEQPSPCGFLACLSSCKTPVVLRLVVPCVRSVGEDLNTPGFLRQLELAGHKYPENSDSQMPLQSFSPEATNQISILSAQDL